MREKQYTIYMIGRKAICPTCSGMLSLQGKIESITCIDCGEVFKIKGAGRTEREIVCIKNKSLEVKS